jgi:pimeloyl-ACP methyl ester carboxylesterase
MDAALFQAPRRRMIRLADGEMAALEFGDAARPVDAVFLHANGFNALTYRSVLGPLSLSLRLLAVDMRGHGASRLPADPRGRWSWRDLRDDLLAMLQEVTDGPVVLAGHSMGATVALLAAVERPSAVRALALFDPVVPSQWASLSAKAPWLFAGLWRRAAAARTARSRRAVFDSFTGAFKAYCGRGLFRSWPEIMLADYIAAGFREQPGGAVELTCDPAWEASNLAARANDPLSALRRLKLPTQVFRAEHGSACRLRPGMGVLKHNREVQLSVVAGAGPFLPMERPDIVRDALLDAAEA